MSTATITRTATATTSTSLRDVTTGSAGTGTAGADPTVRAAVADGLLDGGPSRALAMSTAAREAVVGDVARLLDSLLDVDVTAIVTSGWARLDDLRDATERTAGRAGYEEVVQLADHTVDWSHRPQIRVSISGSVVHTFEIDLRATARVHGVVAVVRDGHLQQVRTGDAEVTATISIDGHVLVRGTRSIDLPRVVTVDVGHRS